jgi:glutaminase
VYEKKRVKTTKTDRAAKSLIRLRVKQKKRTPLLNVGALLCQKATSKREKRPAPSHAIKTKIKAVGLILLEA